MIEIKDELVVAEKRGWYWLRWLAYWPVHATDRCFAGASKLAMGALLASGRVEGKLAAAGRKLLPEKQE